MHRDRSRTASSGMPDWLIGLGIAILVVAVGFVVLRAAGAGDDPAIETDGPAESETGALSFTLWDGTETSFAAFDGPIVVNFWASWCPPCAAELPDFEAVSDELAGQVTFIGMNVLPDDRQAAQSLIDRTGVDYQLARDEGGEIYTEFGGIAMPTTVFIAADGSIVDVHSGAIFEDDLRELISELFDV